MAEAPINETPEQPSTPNGHIDTNEHATSEADGTLSNGTEAAEPTQNGEGAHALQPADNVFQLTIKLPRAPGQTQLMVSAQEQVQDIRQSIIETPQTSQYSCFHLEHKGKRINDFIELSEFPDVIQDPECALVEDPYTEAQARMHIVRIRELIGAAGDRTDLVLGIDAGRTLCDDIELPSSQSASNGDVNPLSNYDINSAGSMSVLSPISRDAAPKTVKSLFLSAWNPPPYHLKMRGHLLYLQVTTLEGEQYYITSNVSGFYVNRSTNSKFDPTPRSSPKSFAAHSLMTLLGQLSPSFDQAMKDLQDYNSQRDPLTTYQLSNTIPSAPWLVPTSSLQQHQADTARTQEPYLLGGVDGTDTLRDWNEEFQSTRELPKETVQDRVFRERLTSKLFAEYTEAAIRGAVLVGRGEVQPLNPTEAKDSHIFVYNNVFYSFGADGVGTFASDGGDEAARVATGKDVQGVKMVNQLDINGLFTAGTVVIDYLGKRIVGQSIVPGIFKQREPGENQIDYGGVEGKDIVATLESFVKPFSELSKATRVKRHAVWDKEVKKHELEASVETKGLVGTDGRKYVLDLYRLTPLDVGWIEQHRDGCEDESLKYPHRMAVLRTELVEKYRFSKLQQYISKELERKRANRSQERPDPTAKQLTNGKTATSEEKASESEAAANELAKTNDPELTNGDTTNGTNGEVNGTQTARPPQETVDVSGFTFSLNPDVFSGQQPQTDEERAELETDETEVRAVCTYLVSDAIPRLVREVQEGDVGFPMDGQSLVREMHKRGINVRYLGAIARICDEDTKDKRVQALGQLCKQEMVSRAFKHFANSRMKSLPPPLIQSCLSHLLNCLLGVELNAKPQPDIDEEFKLLYSDADMTFAKVTPEDLQSELKKQIQLRYRYDYDNELIQSGKNLQMLREVSLKLGIQLEAKEYQFSKGAGLLQSNSSEENLNGDSTAQPQANGTLHPPEGGKKKKKKNANTSPSRSESGSPIAASITFHPENIVNIVPVIKEAAPRSTLAEEALEAGRIGLNQEQKELGQELLLESLSLHEQIYGILHPEVARVYHALSSLYFNLDEKNAAVELAKKAVIISERTVGIDNAETILAYLNLSLLEHGSGNTKNALAYARHALDLVKMIYGTRHPDSLTTLNNVAIMLQSLKKYNESRGWFEAALDMCEDVTGRPGQAVVTATLLFQLAQCLAFCQDPKSAMARMRESYNIFNRELGSDHHNTKEAESLLDILTNAAVSQARQANVLQSRRLLLRNGRPSRVTMNTRAPPAAAPPTAPVPRTARSAGIDQRNVDELLKYINGENVQTTPKKKPANPKRRR